ncbi:tyrosylprotein sulfotransferase 1, like [Engraulis encrasicolus]|uniref:tyrosylprotein sulfotransferase 1, like n=1 Tax=Engraulis encrasicolus TaxID=184585 RepID=UPI002FD4193C
MRKPRNAVLLASVVVSSVTVFYLGLSSMECPSRHASTHTHARYGGSSALHRYSWPPQSQNSNNNSPGQNNNTGGPFPDTAIPLEYNENTPLIFVGGVPRSGTTLMRAMLDAHPLVRCGEETHVIPRLLAMHATWSRSARERMRLDEAGVTEEVLDAAVRAFLLEVIVGHGELAPRLCNKDPFTLKSLTYLARLFPRAKFVLMMRDGRSVAHSIVSRRIAISGFDTSSYRDCLVKWSRGAEAMYDQCLEAGKDRCMVLRYEQLVLQPQVAMRALLSFLDLPWHPHVLHHEQFIGKAGGVSLSKVERSTDQVMNPVNTDALVKWVGKMPPDVLKDMADIAPMLIRLGYDPHANPPDYTKLQEPANPNPNPNATSLVHTALESPDPS